MESTPQQIVRQVLSVAGEAGLKKTTLAHILAEYGHRLEGRKPTATTAGRLVAKMPDVTVDGPCVLTDHETAFRRTWSTDGYTQAFERVNRHEPYERRTYWGSGKNAWGVLRLLRHALLTGDDTEVLSILRHESTLVSNFRGWFCDPVDPEQLRALTPMSLALVLDQVLLTAVHFMEPLGDLILFVDSLDLTPALAPTAARYALLGGDLPRARALLSESDGTNLHAVLALLDGNVKQACKLFSTNLATQRKYYGADYVPTDMETLFLPVAYLLHTAARRKQAMTLIGRAEEQRRTGPGAVREGWAHLKSLAEPKLRAQRTTHPVALLFESCVELWRGDQPDTARTTQAIESLRDMGFHLFADELQAGVDGRIARLRTIRPQWMDTLESLQKALGKNAKAAPHGASSRLAWTLSTFGDHDVDLEARLQKVKKDGWTTGRKVGTHRLHGSAQDTKLPWSPADRKLASNLRKKTYRSYYGNDTELWWDRDATWVGLIGHPAIFDASGQPVRIVGRSPRLVVEHKKGGRHLSLSPALSPGEVQVEQVGRGYEVTRLEGRQTEAARVIGDGLYIPSAGAATVDALVEASQDLFRQADPAAELRDGAPEVHLWMRPRGSSVDVEMGVLPAGPEGQRAIPGVGSAVMLGLLDGEGVRIQRDLKTEVAFLRAVLDLPGLEEADPASTTTLELDAALDLLAAAHTREVPVLWPDGGEIRVRRSAGSTGLAIQSARGWFEAKGSLKLDDGDTIALASLMEQLLIADRRFVKLDDGSYLELEARLKKSLDLLARVGDARGEAIRVHPLALPALAGLLQLDGVKATQPVRRKLQELLAEPTRIAAPRTLDAELRPYQDEAFQWLCGLASLGAGAILADDMGLGKTIVSLAVLLQRRTHGPALVVAPTSVAGNWMREARRFAPSLTMHRLRELREEDVAALGAADVLVCSYSLLVNRLDTLVPTTWSTVVFDESQALKNPTTQRHRAALRLQATFRIALTGTPIENHLGELHAQLSVVLPGLMGSKQRFTKRFARPVEAGDRDVQRALRTVVQPFLLRRTKASVLDDLPERTDMDLLVELGPDEARLYAARREAALQSLDDGATAIDVLGQLTRLRQAACSPVLLDPSFPEESAKTRAFRRLCLDLHEAGHRALVFSQFVKHLALLRAVLDDLGLSYAYLDGSTPAAQRDQLVETFQAGDAGFFLISLKAGGVGLNLTAADYVLHMDPWWNPAVEDQASDRAHRIGQQRPVTVYRVIAKGTVEEQILALHHQKRDLADQILEGTEQVKRLSADDLLELMRG